MELIGLGLALTVGLLLVKEAGVPIPVPGDLLVVGLGVGAADGRFDPRLALVAAVVATIVGGCVQFLLIRGPGRSVVLGLLRRFGIDDGPIERQAERFRRNGTSAVAIARMTPGVRIVTIAAAALAAIPFSRFVVGLAVGNSVFLGGHFALGMLFGAAAAGIVAGLAVPLIIVVGLAVVGAVAWRALASRRRRGAVAAEAWLDACCPACLTLGTVVTR